MKKTIIKICVAAVIAIFCMPLYADVPFDFDKEYRREFAGIMIHHTGTQDSYPSVKFLSDIQKNTVYKPVFNGMGIRPYSNHFYEGRETFFCYHWIVYPDGKKIQVLRDIFKKDGKWYIDYMSWNAGAWDVNGETVAIVLAGNFMNKYPTDAALKAAAGIIAYYKKTTGLDLYIKGHREVKATDCPGNRFLGERGWKKTLLKLVEAAGPAAANSAAE